MKIYLRFAEKEDCRDLFEWRNDETTRKYAFSDEPIRYENHKEWFERSLEKRSRVMLIAFNEDLEKTGQIRFDKHENYAEIDIAVAPDFRGRGIGTSILQKGAKTYMSNFDAEFLLAKIKYENTASIRIFEKCGFVKTAEKKDHVEMILR